MHIERDLLGVAGIEDNDLGLDPSIEQLDEPGAGQGIQVPHIAILLDPEVVDLPVAGEVQDVAPFA